MASNLKNPSYLKAQLVSVLMFASLITHLVAVSAASGGSNSGQPSSEATSSSQPLWSYQVKPNSYGNIVGNGAGSNGAQSAHYTAGPSLFDAFSGLSQRQGALSGSPLMTILPIILIAAGGLLLLLPMFTMMLASPFGGGGIGPFGGGAGGFQNFGYPQMARKRSLDQTSGLGQRGLVDLIEHVSSTIEELARKYGHTSQATAGGQQHKRAKSLNSPQVNESPAAAVAAAAATATATTSNQPANHKPSDEMGNININNNIPAGM